MRKIQSLNSISDGNLYDISDMVKADTYGCKGCSACCKNVGDLVSLTPLDVYHMRKKTSFTMDVLKKDYISFIEEDKLKIPYLKMLGSDKSCSFLNDEERCSIHEYRPDICRLFPLGRVYQQNDYKYFLQDGACVKDKLYKVKVKKWLDIKDHNSYKAFMMEWYLLVKALKFKLKFVYDNKEIEEINNIFFEAFYLNVDIDKEFISEFKALLGNVKNQLGII